MRLHCFAPTRLSLQPFCDALTCSPPRHWFQVLRHGRVAAVPAAALGATSLAKRLSGSVQSPDVSAKMRELMDALAEARELIAEAKESAGSVYVEDDIEDARRQTEKTLTLWKELQDLLVEVGDAAALSSVRNEHELKMSQLSAELEDAEHIIGQD